MRRRKAPSEAEVAQGRVEASALSFKKSLMHESPGFRLLTRFINNSEWPAVGKIGYMDYYQIKKPSDPSVTVAGLRIESTEQHTRMLPFIEGDFSSLPTMTVFRQMYPPTDILSSAARAALELEWRDDASRTMTDAAAEGLAGVIVDEFVDASRAFNDVVNEGIATFDTSGLIVPR